MFKFLATDLFCWIEAYEYRRMKYFYQFIINNWDIIVL